MDRITAMHHKLRVVRRAEKEREKIEMMKRAQWARRARLAGFDMRIIKAGVRSLQSRRALAKICAAVRREHCRVERLSNGFSREKSAIALLADVAMSHAVSAI